MSNITYIKNKIKSSDVVSFDIFDTLIKRDVPCPTDVFDLVYSKFSGEEFEKNTDYKCIREKAENTARKETSKKDINLDDIYRCMPNSINDDDKKVLLEIEKKIELSVCKKNVDIENVYDFARKNDKKIIITTDMYLPFSIIKMILENNGFDGYENIFLSNELNASKADGSLFDILKKNYPKSNIVHIGDNIKSDVINARKHGIAGCHWKKDNNKLSYDVNQNYISNFINNRIRKDNNYYYNFGYQCMGPLLFSFSKWINESVKKDNVKDLFFLARDGKIMQRAYDLLFNDEGTVRTHYLLASRKGYIIPTLYKYNSVEESLSKMFTSNFISLKYLMTKLNINEDEISNVLLKSVDLDRIYNNLESIFKDDKANAFLDEIFKVAVKKSKKDDYNLNKYLQDNNFYKNVGIVDIGWFGNMQNALIKITDNDKIHGYYLGVNSKSQYKNSQNMQGFLFNGAAKDENEIYVRTFAGVLELLFTRYDVGSFKGFTENEGKLVPIYDKNEYSNEYSRNSIKAIQDASLDFIVDFKNSYLHEVIDIDMYESFKRLKKFATDPSHKDIIMFNNIHKNNEKHLEFISKNNAFKYLVNPKKFSDDLQSSWFEAYIYKTFKVKIPVAKIYRYLKMKG